MMEGNLKNKIIINENQGIELEMLGFLVWGFSRDALELRLNLKFNFL